MRNVVLLGSTGSIGTSTIKVAEDLPDRIRLLGLAAGNNAELLLEQTRKHRPEAISIADPAKAKDLRDTLGTAVEVHSGAEGLLKLRKAGAATVATNGSASDLGSIEDYAKAVTLHSIGENAGACR